MLEEEGLQADNQMPSRSEVSQQSYNDYLRESPREQKTCPAEITDQQNRKPEYT